MVIAKNDAAHVKLSTDIAERNVHRYYKAFVWGNIVPPSGTITTNISRGTNDRTRMRVVHPPLGKIATTHYTTLSSWQYVSLVECKLDTGRTHQIRVHLSHVGHSILGDQIYGQNARKIAYYSSGGLKDILVALKRQALHSYKLEFNHPTTGENMSFISELPEDLQKIISVL
jgi:23S rRNA pseudouridine1911/1915/1917 synthase